MVPMNIKLFGKFVRFIVGNNAKSVECLIISSESSSELFEVVDIKYLGVPSDVVLGLSIQRVTSEMHLEQPMSRYCSFIFLLPVVWASNGCRRFCDFLLKSIKRRK